MEGDRGRLSRYITGTYHLPRVLLSSMTNHWRKGSLIDSPDQRHHQALGVIAINRVLPSYLLYFFFLYFVLFFENDIGPDETEEEFKDELKLQYDSI